MSRSETRCVAMCLVTRLRGSLLVAAFRVMGVMGMTGMTGMTGVAFAAGVAPAVQALAPATPAPERLATDIRESVIRVQAIVEDHRGQTLIGDLVVTTYRPPGPGPFPLVVLNHGRPAASEQERAAVKRQRLESASRFFVRKGFAVAVPTRLGYGDTAAKDDPDSSVRCDVPQYKVAAKALATQVAAVVRFMQSSVDIDAQRVVVMGQSVGGFAAMAATGERIPGLVAAIDFAGGYGPGPGANAGEPCRPEELANRFHDFGRRASHGREAVPTLWVFTGNDQFIAAKYQERWAQAYRDGGGRAQTRLMPAFGEDGHQLFARGNDLWQPIVDEFLQPLSFPIPGALPMPQGGVVSIDDTSALPDDGRVINGYRRFLAAKEPRAFATNGRHWGLATGDDAQSHALALCDQHTDGEERCRLYAVNRTVVWSQP